jgi:hypothetical protein
VYDTGSGKKTELHRYFTKIRPDGVYQFHVTSVTHEIPGKKPQVTHTVEVKKTDNSGRVTTEVHQHGDELGWHAGKSKWNSKPQITKPAPPPSPSASLAFGHTTPPPR